MSFKKRKVEFISESGPDVYRTSTGQPDVHALLLNTSNTLLNGAWGSMEADLAEEEPNFVTLVWVAGGRKGVQSYVGGGE